MMLGLTQIIMVLLQPMVLLSVQIMEVLHLLTDKRQLVWGLVQMLQVRMQQLLVVEQKHPVQVHLLLVWTVMPTQLTLCHLVLILMRRLIKLWQSVMRQIV
ncbi:hypothetical protein DPW01_09645 [Aggregatibacter aphrophilus]|nr:hypothetical protein DPW00_09490 [Aggregatibacter aphrophilus]RDE89946.1 hypothetical protein DPW01_09645 [Aggregatibacter aphrophilus]